MASMKISSSRSLLITLSAASVGPSGYLRSVFGILWDNGQDFQTYFGGNPIYIHGIQWFPISPVLSYFVPDPVFARQNYNSMLTEQLDQIGVNTVGSPHTFFRILSIQ